MQQGLEKRDLRKRGLKKFAQRQEPGKMNYSKDLKELIHDLRVHQVELKAQTEELRRAQQAIEESRRKYADLYDFAPVGYFTLDFDRGAIVEANLTGASLLAVERERLMKAHFLLYVMPGDRDLFLEFKRKVFQIPGKHSCELKLMKKGDIPFWVRLEGLAVKESERKLTRMQVGVIDIAERRQLEESLKKSKERLQGLSSKLLHTQEMERKSIAHEIHDGILSELAAVNLNLMAKIEALGETNHPIAADLRKLLHIHQRTMKETRQIMNRLRPSILDDLGLIPAMRGFCQEFQMLYPKIQLECKLEISEEWIPEALKVVIFRIAQEALTNSARHAGGTWAKIALAQKLGGTAFMVQDNGHGFDLENTQKGVGLESIRERVEISGGEFQIESGIGHGTTIRASWPLAEKR